MVLAALGIVVCSYFIFFKDRDDLVYLLAICLFVGVIGYTFQYQIDQLMQRGAPQKLDPPIRNMFLQTSPWFAKLREDEQRLMEDRIKRWVMKKDFINKNEQNAPEDVKYILAFYAVLLTLHQESFMYDGTRSRSILSSSILVTGTSG
jgi:Mlc titration factor MtfA (ptsG expression regulator)